MNKEKVDYSINNIYVPIEKLKAKEKIAISQAKKKRRTIKMKKRSLLVACGLCMSLLGSGFVSTGMAGALSNLPLIGPIYKDFRDIASEKVERDQLATIIDKQDYQNGLTMTVKEAAYDGSRLMVSVIYTGDQEFSKEWTGFGEITINGQPVKRVGGQTGQDEIDSKTIIEHHQLTFANSDEYGDKIEVAVNGENLFGYEGEWKVAFPLEKVAGEVFEYLLGVSATSSDEVITITTEKVTFSPLATTINVNVDYPVELNEDDKWPAFEYKVIDDKGKIYEGLTLQIGMVPGKYGHHIVLTLPPMDTIPSSFTIKPIRANSEGIIEEVKELELVVPLEKMK